jgi:hypothetical protein
VARPHALSVQVGCAEVATELLMMQGWSQGIDDVCVHVIRLFPRGGGVRVVTKTCRGPRLLAWHSVSDKGTTLGGFL